MPGQYLRRSAPPLVISLSLRRRDDSPRWKEIVEPYPGRFMHHMELSTAADVDEELRALIAEAWEAAG